MKKRRLFFITILLALGIAPTLAQWDASFADYRAARSYYNPSFAGNGDNIDIVALYRYPWSNMRHSPQQVFVTANMPVEFLGRKHGIAISIYNEMAQSERNTLLSAQYTFKQELGDGFLNIWLQAGAYTLSFDAGSRHFISDTLSTAIGIFKTYPLDNQLLDFNMGVSWTGRQAFAGLSVIHITSPGLTAGDSIYSHIPRAYNFMAGYNIRLFSPLELQPMVQVHGNKEAATLNMALMMVYDKRISWGAAWTIDKGYAFFAGANLKDLQLGYAYELYTEGVGVNSQGGHELRLGYKLPLNYGNPKWQPHKSIRLL